MEYNVQHWADTRSIERISCYESMFSYTFAHAHLDNCIPYALKKILSIICRLSLDDQALLVELLTNFYVRVLASEQSVEIEQESDDQQLKEGSDKAAVLQHKLMQAAGRERQLQVQLDTMKDDVSQLQTRLARLSTVKKELDDFKQRSAPLWEQEMKQRDSRFTMF